MNLLAFTQSDTERQNQLLEFFISSIVKPIISLIRLISIFFINFAIEIYSLIIHFINFYSLFIR